MTHSRPSFLSQDEESCIAIRRWNPPLGSAPISGGSSLADAQKAINMPAKQALPTLPNVARIMGATPKVSASPTMRGPNPQLTAHDLFKLRFSHAAFDRGRGKVEVKMYELSSTIIAG
jgi:hypothetical protein